MVALALALTALVATAACAGAVAALVWPAEAAPAGPEPTRRTNLAGRDGKNRQDGPLRVMVTGDSISQGREGDFTWRYRLWEHFRSGGVNARFVGPWTGTYVIPPAQPDEYPKVDAPISHDGAYRAGIDFPTENNAEWGWTALEAKQTIAGDVARYQPDILLVELGYNDLAYALNTPAGLVADLHTLLTRARAARPSIKVVLADVIHPTPLPGMSPDLDARISEYNALLARELPSWGTASSPVALAGLGAAYQAATDTYDGVHPGGVGEFRVARAFADALATAFGLPPYRTPIPQTVPETMPSAPQSITAVKAGGIVTVRWSHSFGAGGYVLYSRDATLGREFAPSDLPLPADSWKFVLPDPAHTFEYYVRAVHGPYLSPASPTASTARIEALPTR
ncbi:hypothetical protein CcI49_22015 [Frankia sp. CcI49]|uniref:GDSL-type esterase/lipase family protein n=1 Tax=Frankia sp. CcI49 TaxID=1745382 RepID=UPI000978648B|nr:GDSL-type esterase/lipase family protein [Frankia sp. CcI49]ONH58187.1 hypothetical protein CcI49_22015 [Frankia sp. CcI49]